VSLSLDLSTAEAIEQGAPHEPEHALEVELPFLQTVLSSFRLVPLVVDDAAPLEVAHLLRTTLRRLAQLRNKGMVQS
jgi:AmmeMemoRadiSam system protein B